jgi:hypothetical protein
MKKNPGARPRPARRRAGSGKSKALIGQLVRRNTPNTGAFPGWPCLPCLVLPR